MGKIVAAARPSKAGATASITSGAVVQGSKMKESRNGAGSISAGPVGSAAKNANGNGTVAAAEGKKTTGGIEVNAGFHVYIIKKKSSRDWRRHHTPCHIGIEGIRASP